MKLDVLAFGPHPDDVEIAMGGTLLKLADLGYRTGIVDLTRGEMGSRGTRETRAKEAEEAGVLLKTAVRRTLDLGDGQLGMTQKAKTAIVSVVREYRPSLVFTNYPESNHPDHSASGPLVAEASYLAGLAKFEAEGEPHRPNRVLYYFVPHKVPPSFVVDVSDYYEAKLTAIQAHASQLHDGSSGGPETYTARPDFLSRIESLDRYFGALIDADFGEAFFLREAMKIEDPVSFFGDPFTRIT